MLNVNIYIGNADLRVKLNFDTLINEQILLDL